MATGTIKLPQLEAMVERIVERKMLELLSDPDEGLELKPHIKARLRRSLAAMRRGERGIPAEQVAKELGLKW